MKPKRPNHLANKTERLIAINALPVALLNHLAEQEQLTGILRIHLSPIIGDVADLCQTVRYHNGQLIVQVPTNTLANHLRYLESSLIASLKTEPAFNTLTEIIVVVLSSC